MFPYILICCQFLFLRNTAFSRFWFRSFSQIFWVSTFSETSDKVAVPPLNHEMQLLCHLHFSFPKLPPVTHSSTCLHLASQCPAPGLIAAPALVPIPALTLPPLSSLLSLLALPVPWRTLRLIIWQRQQWIRPLQSCKHDGSPYKGNTIFQTGQTLTQLCCFE